MPSFMMPKLPKGMRGRPIALEEFERILALTYKTVTTAEEVDLLTSEQLQIVASWQFYLKRLWASGLRLEESLMLRWDDGPESIVVDYSRKRPLFRIDAEAEKGKTHRLLPMAPEFATLLEEVPIEQRKGWVFQPLTVTGNPVARSRHAVGPRVSKIGEKLESLPTLRPSMGRLLSPMRVLTTLGGHSVSSGQGF
jgi:integrase